LKMVIRENSEKEAEQIVRKLCEELRIYNPIVSNCTVKSIGPASKYHK
jgi:phosphoribosylformylglycinamidine (FGAM) synthase PurS component